MTPDLFQSQALPFVKLAQANVELLMRFATSPDVSVSAMKLMQSGAYTELMRGLMKNQTEFLTELGRSSMTLLGQGGLAMVEQMQAAADSATSQVIDADDARTRRNRQRA